MAIYPNFYQTLLPCPIVELRGYLSACGLKGRLYAYLDFDGPTGTSRDALAEGMLALAAEQHALAPGQPIIEASTGAFAAALTLASRTAGRMPRPCGRSICSASVPRFCTPRPGTVWPVRGRWPRARLRRTAGTI